MTDNKSSGTAKSHDIGRDIIFSLMCRTCVWFTVCAMAILLVTQLIALASPQSSNAVLQVSRFLWLFPFALCAALAGQARRSQLPAAGRVILHILLSLGGALLFLYTPLAVTQKHTPSQMLLWVVLFTVLYLVGLIIYLIVMRKRRAAKTGATPYRSQFTKP